ncbi:MAG TPA: malto-oligosyltrehalose trehalohydrolase [Gemmatimonadaceae bacterium]|nr:malto-oligosyltrehalose trehalohydrolase [Gemmatimonadaceae bacterium]
MSVRRSTASANWALDRGATVRGADGTEFRVWAPHADRVEVVVPGGRVGLEPDDTRTFECVVKNLTPGSDYAYSIDGGPLLPDPVSRFQPAGVRGPSRIVDPHSFSWHDAAWTGHAMADYVIYELHVGTFTRAGTFDAVIDHLTPLAQLGITAIELMPVAEFPGTRNWGYDGVHLFAPQHSYGGPEALRRLVDAAHGAGLAVILDVVYNHIGPEGSALEAFAPYLSTTHASPWGASFDFDGPSPSHADVRRYVIDNALYWIVEYHIDALRLDAVPAIRDDSTPHIVQEIAAAVHAVSAQLGRRVHVIAESDVMDPVLVRATTAGGFGLDAQWSDDFQRGAHVALTGERIAWYRGVRGAADLAAALERTSTLRSPRGIASAPATDVSAAHFVFYVQNHDQVGNRARGERLTALVSPPRRALATALLLLSPYVPLLFMGEEYDELRPFLYFVNHESDALCASVRDGRVREIAERGHAVDPVPPDPAYPDTFERSRLDRDAAGASSRAVLALYRDLLAIRREEPALHPGRAAITATTDPAGAWLTVELRPAPPNEPRLLAAYNFSDAEQVVPTPAAPANQLWRLRFSTRNARYGGPSDTPRLTRKKDGVFTVRVLPESAVLYRLEDR